MKRDVQILLTVLTCSLLSQVCYTTICGKFQVTGPCATVTTTTTPADLGADSDYCQLACSQGADDVFSSLCDCATTTPATTMATTTPRPESCYYTRNRPAKLQSVNKRMYSAKPIAKNCEYPGVVGIYNATNSKVLCMGILLEENVIAIDSFCFKLVNSTKCVAAIEMYQKPSDLTTLPTVVASSALLLDPTKANNKIYTITLSKAVVFNDGCVQPACVPNANLPMADIDLNDCRLVGYGDINDTIGATSSVLLEVKVVVNPSSVASGNLIYSRVDGISSRTGPCFSDQGAPLICNHLVTGEWVTIGLVTTIGFKCSIGSFTSPVIVSLLKESTNNQLYNGLQKFKYIPD
ncbi:uncharacterized protein LOC106070089 [Biomphalaria glabrata]|uniref:Uncharacterized protein LOC106070089 n=1 Tax=Biomphalaria glabrata TaxID=6526 RepID=A0A9W3AXP7_BIOGL|nr:uncharacterized protein LOC106070089 [Biomphalaria glabrata]